MKGLRTVLLIAAATGAFLLTATQLRSQDPTVPPEVIVPPIVSVPEVTSRPVVFDGMTFGEVLVGDMVVLRIREAAGGFTAPERASIVAGRLATQLGMGYNWADVAVGQMGTETVLLMGEELLVTVDSRHARLNNTTPFNLAQTWREQAQVALQGTPGVVGVVAGAQEEWPDWTNAGTKIVPIISLGTPGLRLGFAQVSGPENRVDQVDAVAQLDLVFRDVAQVYAFIPSSSLTALDRVQGVAVTALLNYELVRF